MKHISPIILSFLTLIALGLNNVQVQAQTILLSEYFTAYDGTSATVPANWIFNYNGNYTSTQSSGVSGPNSYKFGVNNATITSPSFSNADSVRFFIKGNSADTISSLSVFEGTDTLNMTLVAMLKPISNTGTTISLKLLSSSTMLRYVYTKSVGNVAFDDFEVIRNGPSAITTIEKNQIVLYPNPARNNVSIDLGTAEKVEISLYNMIGKNMGNVLVSDNGKGVYTLNLNSVPVGTYFVQVKTDRTITTRRLQVQK